MVYIARAWTSVRSCAQWQKPADRVNKLLLAISRRVASKSLSISINWRRRLLPDVPNETVLCHLWTAHCLPVTGLRGAASSPGGGHGQALHTGRDLCRTPVESMVHPQGTSRRE